MFLQSRSNFIRPLIIQNANRKSENPTGRSDLLKKAKHGNSIESTAFQIGKVHRAFVNRLNHSFQSYGYNLTVEQWSVLYQIFESEEISQLELTAKLNRDKTTVTRLLDGVVHRQLVNRKSDKTDRRQKRLELTSSGKTLISNLIPLVEETIKEAEKGIGRSELKGLSDTLAKLHSNLSQRDRI